MNRPQGEERISALAEKIRSNSRFRSELADIVDRLPRDDKNTVISAVVRSGLCEDKLVRSIRSELASLGPREEGMIRLDQFEKDFDARNGLKDI
jgi:hypothetical protein